MITESVILSMAIFFGLTAIGDAIRHGLREAAHIMKGLGTHG